MDYFGRSGFGWIIVFSVGALILYESACSLELTSLLMFHHSKTMKSYSSNECSIGLNNRKCIS